MFVFVALCLAIGCLLFAGAPAFAAAPEVPLLGEVTYRATGSVSVRGSLNPKAAGEGGTYEFIYKQSSSECTGGKAKTGGLSFGSERETVTEKLSELEPGTEYTICLVAHNLLGETSRSAPLTVKTTSRAEVPEAPETAAASGTSNAGATLEGVVNPHTSIPVKWFFQYAAGASCNGGQRTAAQPAGEAQELQDVRVSAKVTGLEPGTKYTFCLVARNEAEEASTLGPADEVSFTTTASQPVVSGEAATTVGSTEATVAATLEGFGSPTGYRLEYGTSEPYAPTTETSVGAINSPTGIRVRLTGLDPASTYHFRFRATSPVGSTLGGDTTFATLGATTSGSILPDSRAYELVSSVGNPGEVYVPQAPESLPRTIQDVFSDQPFRAGADGEAVAYMGDPGSAGGNGNSGLGNGNQFLATRDPQQGRWEVSDISPPINPAQESPLYEAFSPDLSLGILASPSGLGLASPDGPAGCNVLYGRSSSGGSLNSLFNETQTPGFCGFIENGVEIHSPAQELRFAGGNAGTPDVKEDTRLLFQTPAALTPGSKEAPQSFTGEANNLYDSMDGHLYPVNVLGNGESDPNAVFGAPPGAARGGANFSDVISADGSHVFWTDLRTHDLYARENPALPTAMTVQLDAKEEGAEGESGSGLFWTASADGSIVLFTDCSRLTVGSTAIATKGCVHLAIKSEEANAGENYRVLTGNDLYEFDFNKPAGKQLVDLTRDTNTTDPLGADVQGVLATSSDGSYIYFVAGGALAPGAEHRNCAEAHQEVEEKGENGEPISPEELERLVKEQKEEELGRLPAGRGCNLYLERIGEAPRFIAALAAKDDRLRRFITANHVSLGDWQREFGARTAEATPDGPQLVFQSTQHLTGYDSSSLFQLEGAAEDEVEVFVYDSTAGPSGRIFCASCDPRGAPPAVEGRAAREEREKGGQASEGGSFLPVSISPTSLRRWISQDGSRVFFDSSQPLVPQDTNGIQDVYEWEREGTAGCRVATSMYGGCVFLLSGGTSEDNSFFVDADQSGDNVFFTHRGGLGGIAVPDGKVNLFDARVDGGFPEPRLACTGTGCQGVPPAAPTYAVPPSVTFTGAGNYPPPALKPVPETRTQKLAKALRACRKDRSKKRRTSCEKGARARYRIKTIKAKKARKASDRRRTGR